MRTEELRGCAGLFDEYTELRVQENRSIAITMINGDVTSNRRASQGGVSARVNKNGVWGFCSASNLSDATFERVVSRATHDAKFLDSREKRGKGDLPATNCKGEFDYATKHERRSQKELLDFVRKLDEHIQQHCKGLSSRLVTLQALDMQKTLLTSEGSLGYSMTPRALIYVDMTITTDGEPISLLGSYGGLGHFEDQFHGLDALYADLDRQYEHLQHKASGIYAEAGVKECILDADLAGILAHEAIGHTTEADYVMGGSVARSYMDREVASPLVTLVDFAHTALGKTCPVPVHIDDEGTTAKDVTIIEDGVLKSYMHNKETASHFESQPQGNARAFLFSDEPLIRMRNTAILPGTSKLDDMIASIDDGYYLMKPGNGQADSTSEFMFAVVQGYEIKNGKLGRGLKDLTISGVAFDLLKTVSMLSDDMKWTGAGMCGKKQPIPVGMGGPAIKCSVNIGGK